MTGSTSRPPTALVTALGGLALVVRSLVPALIQVFLLHVSADPACLVQAALTVIAVVRPFSNEVSN